MTKTAPPADGLRAYLAVLDQEGSTASEIAVRVYGQSGASAINRTLAALRRLKDEGLAYCERNRLHVVWLRSADGQAWLAQTGTADPGRVKYGAGMVDYGN